MEAFGGALQALTNFTDRRFVQLLAQLLFLTAAKFDQMIYQLGFAAGFAGNFQAAQSRRLHIEVAHFTGALADTSQELEKLFLTVAELGRKFAQKYLEAPSAGAKTVYTSGARFRGEIDEIAFEFLKDGTAGF
jgi:hypothetical protein